MHIHLLVMRHGEAENYASNDAARNLTARGIAECQSAGRWLQANLQCVDLALVSPFVRAQQSAAALADSVPIKDRQDCPDLVPAGDAQWVNDYVDALLTEQQELRSLLLVSHMPIVSALVDRFCQQQLFTLFTTSAIVQLDYDTTTGTGQLVNCFQGH